MDAEDILEFMYEGMPVGFFEEAEYPRQGGRYRYMPYRGAGHYQMQVELGEKGSARCSYTAGSERVTFAVVACPEYGLLELADFEAKDSG